MESASPLRQSTRDPSPEDVDRNLSTLPGVVEGLRRLGTATAILVLAIGVSEVASRLAHAGRLPLSERPVTAVAFSLAGVFLLLRSRTEFSANRAALFMSRSCAVGVFLIGLAQASSYAFGVPLLPGPNHDPEGFGWPAAILSVRVAPTTAALLIATGTALLWFDTETRLGARPYQSILLAVSLFAIAALGINLFGTFTPRANAPYPAMSAVTAFQFLLVALAGLCLRPDRGAMRVITVQAVGGTAARRLLPAALFGPIALCTVCYVGYVARLYDSGFGLALLTTLNSAVLTTLVWRTAHALNVADSRRLATEAELRSRQAEIEALNARLRRSMAETHHRVRNNLQAISAFVDMQVMAGGASVPVGDLERIGAQVQALAAVHDILTREARGNALADTLSAGEVLERLAAQVQRTLSGRRISVDAEPVQISAKQASALVVIANELITNALKYSHSDVEIRLRSAGGEVRLEVLDAGAGFPCEFNPASDASTGLELVQQVAAWDLKGRVEFDNREQGGGRVTLRMPLEAER